MLSPPLPPINLILQLSLCADSQVGQGPLEPQPRPGGVLALTPETRAWLAAWQELGGGLHEGWLLERVVNLIGDGLWPCVAGSCQPPDCWQQTLVSLGVNEEGPCQTWLLQ